MRRNILTAKAGIIMPTHTLTAEDVLESLTQVIDPEHGVNIVDMGLIYGIEVAPGVVTIEMTLTRPDAPARERIVAGIHDILHRRHPGLDEIIVDFVWEPAWRPDFVSEQGRIQMKAPILRQESETTSPLTTDAIVDALKRIDDPEVGVNIVDLGLVYGVMVTGTDVRIVITLTRPGCALQASVEDDVRRVLETRFPEITGVEVTLVWEPAWDTDRITEAGRRALRWQ